MPPLLVTFLGGRTGWLWLSFFLTNLIIYALCHHAAHQIATGQDAALVRAAVMFQERVTDSSMSLHLAMAGSAIGESFGLALLVGLLLFLRPHPHRTTVDIALFWCFVALQIAAVFTFVRILQQTGMLQMNFLFDQEPSLAIGTYRCFLIATYTVVFLAALRPICSWWRARKLRV